MLDGVSGGTNFEKPILLLKDLIEREKKVKKLKTLVVVFLTDGQNDDPIETAEAFHQLEQSLNGISS